jgi:membrane-associated phospholipid phosphatase
LVYASSARAVHAQSSDIVTPPGPAALLKEVPIDLWHFVSWRSAGTLTMGGAVALVGHNGDDDLADDVETSVRLNDALAPAHTYGAFHIQVAIGIGAYALGHAFGQRRMAVVGSDVIRAQLLSQLYAQALKVAVQRERPDESDNYSFPSGHSASAFATAGVFREHFGWKIGLPAYVVAAYVAAARVKDNRHHLSDVMFGAALGLASSNTIALHPIRREMSLAPSIGPRHASIAFHLRPMRTMRRQSHGQTTIRQARRSLPRPAW